MLIKFSQKIRDRKLGRLKRRWEDDDVEMDLKEMGLDDLA